MRSVLQTASFAFLSLVLGSCNYYRPNMVQSAPEPNQVNVKANFQSMMDGFFKPYCIRCHRGATPGGDVSLETYQAMLDTEVLVPGKPEDSMIFTDTRDGVMPKRPPMPSPEAVEMLRVWIADGALEK